MLARIEHFCVGVEQDIYDWETVYELAHGFFDGTVQDWLTPLVNRKQSFVNGYDPYANTRKVWARMEAKAAEEHRSLSNAN